MKTNKPHSWATIATSLKLDKGYPELTKDQKAELELIPEDDRLAVLFPVANYVEYDGAVGVDIYSKQWTNYAKVLRSINDGAPCKLEANLDFISQAPDGIPGFVLYLTGNQVVEWASKKSLKSIIRSMNVIETGVFSTTSQELHSFELDCKMDKIKLPACFETAKIINNFLLFSRKNSKLSRIQFTPPLDKAQPQKQVIHFTRPRY